MLEIQLVMQTILGIDIGSYSVKVAELQRSFKNFAFTSFFERRVQYNDVLTPEESQTAALQAILEDNALTWDTCYVALPGQHLAARNLVLPFGKTSRIEQALPFEIEEHMPFELSDIVYDYLTLESTKDMARLLAFYAQKKDVANFLSCVNSAGIEPRKLCSAGIELVNLVAMGLVAPDAAFAIVDIGHEQTTITICDRGRFAYSRTVSIAGDALSRAIAQELGVSAEEAQQLKHDIAEAITHGDLPPADTIPHKVIAAVHAVLDDLLLQMRQTFFSYRQQSGHMVQGVYLSGGSARLPGLDDYVSFHLQQNVTRINCHDFAFTRVDRSEVDSAVSGTALSLALRAVAPSGLPSIDLRKDEFAYRADTQQLGGRLRRFAAAGIFLMLLVTGWFSYRWHSLDEKLVQVEQELQDVIVKALPKNTKKAKSPEDAVRLLAKATKDASQRYETLHAVLQPSALNTLRRFSSSVPSRDDVQMDVDIFEYTPKLTKVKVLAASSPDVDKIQRQLSDRLTVNKGKATEAPDGGDPLALNFGNPKEVKVRGREGGLTFQVTMESMETAEANKGKKRRKKRRAR